MKTLMRLPFTLFALSLPVTLEANNLDTNTNWQATFDGIKTELIIPDYQAFSQSAMALNQGVVKLCQQPSQARLTHAHQLFRSNLADWQRVQWLNFGPVTLFMRYYAFEYWPDKKGLTQRQLTSLIKNQVDLEDKKFWHSASIAVRGLTAIESLLYRSQFDPLTQPSYCNLLVKVAEHHQESANRVLAEWQNGELADWVFMDEDDDTNIVTLSLEKMIQQWLEHISVVKESKIETPIGWHGKANVKLAEFYKSQSSLNAIKQNTELYLALYHAGKRSLYQIALEQEPELAKQLDQSLKQAIQQINALPQDFYNPEFESESRIQLATPVIKNLSKSQNELLSLVTNMGFQIGFNSRDGD